MDLTPLKQVAQRLLAWEGAQRIGASDVLAWVRNGVPCFAFWGDSVKLESHVFANRTWNNQDYRVDIGLQRAMGFEVSVQHWDRSYRIRSFESDIGQTMSNGTSDVGEVFEAIQRVVSEVLGTDAAITIIAKEGQPWNWGEKSTPYYSAKKNRELSGVAPEGVLDIEVVDRDTEKKVRRPAVDLCLHAGVVAPTAREPIVAVAKGMQLLLTHSFNLEIRSLETAGSVRQCGGLLFPSMALGEIPASTFGTVSLFASVSTVLEGLKPYRTGRGAWPVTLYRTDAWTGGTKAFVTLGATTLFEQLAGYYEVDVYINDRSHMWTLGPPIASTGVSSDHPVTLVKSSNEMIAAMSKRTKLWTRKMTKARMEQLSGRPTDRYPYLEAKSNSVLAPACFPLAVCPTQHADKTAQFLSAAGFRCELLTIDVEPKALDAITTRGDDLLTYEYAWVVRDVALDWAERNRMTVGVLT